MPSTLFFVSSHKLSLPMSWPSGHLHHHRLFVLFIYLQLPVDTYSWSFRSFGKESSRNDNRGFERSPPMAICLQISAECV